MVSWLKIGVWDCKRSSASYCQGNSISHFKFRWLLQLHGYVGIRYVWPYQKPFVIGYHIPESGGKTTRRDKTSKHAHQLGTSSKKTWHKPFLRNGNPHTLLRIIQKTTPPKFKSLPLKSFRIPKGKACLAVPSVSQSFSS